MNGEGAFKVVAKRRVQTPVGACKRASRQSSKCFVGGVGMELKEREFTASYGFNGLKNNK
jgi:hypothetical protein